MTPGQVVVVGLGPAGADLVLPAARTAIVRTHRRFVRTARHPAVAELSRHGLDFESFDARYEEASDLEQVYSSIVATLVSAVHEGGTVAYAVPGNPAVAERTVTLLHEAAARGEIRLSIIPGLSFADLAWSKLGVDPCAGGRIVDGQRFATDAAGVSGRLLIGQCDTQLVLSDVKLALLEVLAPETPVTVLQRLGLTDEFVRVVQLVDLDRVVEPDHLTTLYVDTGTAAVAGEFGRLVELMERLRAPGGCPWDAEQTHHSLSRYTLEEAYEVVEAIEALPFDAPEGGVDDAPDAYAALGDELGDLLCQVVFHSVLAREAGAFTVADVVTGIHDKLVRRHPHVFGDPGAPMTGATTSDDVMHNWEQIKKQEKATDSLVEGITPGLPSLLYAHKLFRKAASVGLDPGTLDDAIDRIEGAASRLRAGDDPENALADLLAGAVVAARAQGVDAESVLRGWAARFRERFVRAEALAAEQGTHLGALDPAGVAALWLQATSG
jgi:tetrapyrrole methylase family protein / MazG family protein